MKWRLVRSIHSIATHQSTTTPTKLIYHLSPHISLYHNHYSSMSTAPHHDMMNKNGVKPIRIVTLLPSATEIIALLQHEAIANNTTNKHKLQLIGRSHECDYPITDDIQSAAVLTRSNITSTDSIEIDNDVKTRLHDTNSLYTLDSQLLQSLNPDIIITQSLCAVCSIDYNTVKQIRDSMTNSNHIKILCLNPMSLNDVINDIIHIGNELDMINESYSIVARLHRRYDRVLLIAAQNVQYNQLNNVPRIRCAYLEWLAPIYPAGHWTSEMIELTGAIHTLGRINIPSIELDNNILIDSQPSHIILGPCGFNLHKTISESELHLFNQPWFVELDAVSKYHNLCVVDGNQYFNRSGPRLIDCFEFLVGYLYDRYELIPNDFVWQSVELTHVNQPHYTTHTIKSNNECSSTPNKLHNNNNTDNNYDTIVSSNKYNPIPLPAITLPLLSPDIELAHSTACQNKQDTYIDPQSGYTVFTEYAHRKRNVCCGSKCRHCPFNWVNVKPKRHLQHNKKYGILSTTYMKYDMDDTEYDNVDVLFYSGGKDSYCTLLHLVYENQCKDTTKRKIILLTTFGVDTQSDTIQGTTIQHIINHAQHVQHDIICIPLNNSTNNTYINCIRDALQQYTAPYQSVRLIFGDLHLYDIVQWRQSSMNNIVDKCTVYFPLLYQSYIHIINILNKFSVNQKKPFGCVSHVNCNALTTVKHTVDADNIDPGMIERYGYYKIIISNTNHTSDILYTGAEWNNELLCKLNNTIDLFGENGEYHTYVQLTPP